MKKRNCRICGKEYSACRTELIAFDYRQFACSPECGKEYLARIEASRSPEITKEKIHLSTKPKDKIEETK